MGSESIPKTSIAYSEQVIFRNIRVYTCTHARIINEQRGHEFEREQERANRKAWREETEEEMI